MNISCFIILVVFGFNFTFGQEEKRIEFDLRGEFEEEQVSPMGDKGLLIQSFGTDVNKGIIRFINELFSTDLESVDVKYVEIPSRSYFGLVYYDQKEHIDYSLLVGKRNYWVIVKADANSRNVEKTEFEYDSNASLSNIFVKGEKAYFKCILKKVSKLLIVDMKTGAVTDVDFEFDKYRRTQITLEDYQVLDDEIVVYVNARENKRVENLYFFQLSLVGKRVAHHPLTLDLEEKLISISTDKLGDKYILSGTYGKGRINMSQGIFFAELKDKKLEYIEFYNFLNLNNFTDYLPDGQQRRIERKKHKKAEQGKELVLNYNIALHPVKEVVDGYELLGEAFFPVYVTYMCGQNNWCTSFEGFQYTHAVMAKFDMKGKLKWDASFEMWVDRKPYYVRRFITKNTNPLGVEMVFGNGKELVHKVVNPDNGSVIKEETQEIIDTQKADDKVKRSESDVEYWYDDYFVAFGIQKIGNKEEKRKRRVFFVNKIKVKP